MGLLVRSWNVFHGNAVPPERQSRLRQMVELASADRPGIVCLQEIPVWALPRLGRWSGMKVFPAVTRRALGPAALAGWITRVHNGLLRSALAGQANAILLAPALGATDLGSVEISDSGRERRVCQAVRVDGLVVANLHASSAPARPEVAAAELARARSFVEGLAGPGEPVVLAGDFNLQVPRLDGYSPPGPGIDHVLVRGAPVTPLVVWPEERRVRDGAVLSDHAPVEAVVG